jgi:hypothetical protein
LHAKKVNDLVCRCRKSSLISNRGRRPDKKPNNPAFELRWCETMILSRTVMFLKTVVSWNVRTTPRRATSFGDRLDIGLPSNTTSPLVVLRNDEINLNNVDFPAPFGPITESTSCSLTSKLTSETAVRPPNFFVRFLTCRIISPHPVNFLLC